MSLKWNDDAADGTRMSVPPPLAPPRAPATPDPKLTELRALRRTVQGVVVTIVAILVIAGLIALTNTSNDYTAENDCYVTATTDAELESCLGS